MIIGIIIISILISSFCWLLCIGTKRKEDSEIHICSKCYNKTDKWYFDTTTKSYLCADCIDKSNS